MRLVIQRVTEAQVISDGELTGKIGNGLMVLMGIHIDDEEHDIEWLVRKLVNLRIFSDEEGKMNLSLLDVKGQILLVSQFTLYASTKKGNRPSFIQAAPPAQSIPLYEKFIEKLRSMGVEVHCGIFGADMKVSLTNDGPVTIIMDSRDPE